MARLKRPLRSRFIKVKIEEVENNHTNMVIKFVDPFGRRYELWLEPRLSEIGRVKRVADQIYNEETGIEPGENGGI